MKTNIVKTDSDFQNSSCEDPNKAGGTYGIQIFIKSSTKPHNDKESSQKGNYSENIVKTKDLLNTEHNEFELMI